MNAILEAMTDLAERGRRARAGFRALTPQPPAGGICRVAFVLEALDAPLYVLVGMDRGTGRPAHVTIRCSLDETPLEDPAQGRVGLGGPSGPVLVEPGTPFTQVLLVNQFARLETARDLMAPGETRLLSIDCRRAAPLAATPKDALGGSVPGTATVAAQLRLPLVRDDAALEAEVAALVAVVRAHAGPGTSNDLEDALAALAALRLPAATAALATLTDSPNPQVRDVASRAATGTT